MHLDVRAELLHRFDQFSRMCFTEWKRVVTSQHYSILENITDIWRRVGLMV